MTGVASRPPSLVQRLVSLAAIAVALPTLAAIPVQADTRPGVAAIKAATSDDRPDPLLAVISLSRQRIRVYDRTGVVARSRVSTGMRGHRTPTGVFSILQRRRHHRSNIYSNAPMPYMQRLTWSGIALHAGVVPRYPASHGCIRLPYPFAAKLWKMTEIGTPVVVAPEDASPVPIQHARLPVPRFIPASPDEMRQADRDGPVERGRTLASADTTVTDAGAELAAGVRLLSPLQRARAYKARAKADAAAAKRAARRAVRKARAKRAEARRAAKARRRAERALAAAQRRNEMAAEAATASALERARALERAEAELAAAEAALAAARMQAHEARLLYVVWTDGAAERADPGQARRAARARERAERTLATAQRRHEEAVEDAETSALERARASAQAKAAVAAAKSALAAARVAVDQARLLDVVREDAAAAAAAARTSAKRASRAAADAYKATRRIERPISIFVSRKEERVFVRRAWKSIHEAPVTFKDGPPLGTHVYLAMGPTADGRSMDWLSVSLPARESRRESRRRHRAQEAASAPAAPPETAATVLERFELPEATRRFIADRLWAGAALIVSDHGLGHETGEYTDFIVVTR